MKKFFGFLFIVLFLTSCGYKPSMNYARDSIGGLVYVEVKFSNKNPKNTVLIKDAMNELVITKFGRKLTHHKELADTIINLKLKSYSLGEISFDKDGYIKLYRAKVSIATTYAKYKDGKKITSKSFTTSGFYDFSIDDEISQITDAKTYEAIKESSSKALDEIISRIAVSDYSSHIKNQTSDLNISNATN